jgi:hypothetical protein
MPSQGHFLDDEELVACWESGLVSAAQRDEIVTHLADCPSCRHRLAGMVRGGEIALAEQELVSPSVSVPVSTIVRPGRWLSSWIAVAVAASIFVVLGTFGWLNWGPGAPGGIRSGSALALRGKVTDYGFLLDGETVTKGAFAVVDPSLRRRQAELLSAVQANPNDVPTRIEYGELLLRVDESEEAAKVFQELLKANSRDAAGHMGLGLARFLQGRLDDALAEFEAVLKGDPHNAAARLNAAACLARLGRLSEAERHWQAVLAETQNGELKSQIEQTIRLKRSSAEK